MLHSKIEGSGKTLVFLHGFLESMTMWDFLPLSELPYQKLFIDLPGHGKSLLTDNATVPSMQFMVDEVKMVLETHNITSFSIVGHSMGAYVALLLKEQIPGCEKVVLLNSNFWDDNEQKKKDRLRVADIAFKAKKVFINEAIPNLFGNAALFAEQIVSLKAEAMQMPPEAIAYAALAMRDRKDFTQLVLEKTSDFYIVHGDLDRLVATDFLKTELKGNVQNLFVIENAGHMAHIETPSNVMELLKEIFG